MEKHNMAKPAATCENTESLWVKFKKLVRKGNNTRFIIHKKEVNILSLPVTLAVIITIIAPYLTFIGFIVALFTGYRIKFEGKGMECGKVNEMMDKVADGVDCAKRKLSEDSSNAAETN
jgi:hypothetical protein